MSEAPNSSPEFDDDHNRLLDVMEEINAVVKKHDLGAVVILSSQKVVTFRMILDATWSAAFIEHTPNGPAVRVRAKRADFPTAEAQTKTLEDTIGMFMGFANVVEHLRGMLKGLAEMLGQQVAFEDRQTTLEIPPDRRG